MTPSISIGLPGATPAALIRELAPRIEAAGFGGVWLNDTPGGDSLAGLATAATVTTTLRLGAGVIPLDRRSAASLVPAIAELPADRLWLGLGTGAAKAGLSLMADAVETLRAASGAHLVVGALGPRMRRLGARSADGVLLNWLTPAAAAAAMVALLEDSAGRSVRGILYVRTSTELAARAALEAEAAAYSSYPAYAANFERLGITAIDATIDGSDPREFTASLSAYLSAVDELVLRAVVAEPSLEAYVRYLDAVPLPA